ncbi:MAG: alkaline phosphatase family protein [Phycisphaerales bacterium]|nr:alkaline phosphatase family protein [Phycisphaerales bacterium]MCB9862144.1 alkaline phosphatase family protein [Phycisphaerales bacterium]
MTRLLLSALLIVAISSCSQAETPACSAEDNTVLCGASPSAPGATPVILNRSAERSPDQMPMGWMRSTPYEQKPHVASAAGVGDNARVMIVSFDGLRPDAINADIAPTLQSLIDGGSYNPAGLAEIPAVTLPNHSSMVTGLSILDHGVLVNASIEGRIQHTTIFDVAKEHGVSAGFFVNKGKLGYLCAEGEADVRRITGDVDDIANECANAIRENDLRLIFLHFGEPDGAGHSQGWMSEPYLAQVTRADAALARVLDAMAERDVRKDTLLIITADHGGHDKTHGFPIPVDQHVPFILNGPGIAAGRTLTEPVHPMDVAATALTRLGLPATSARDGRDVVEARDDYSPDDTPMEDPMLLFGSLCGPVPWLFLTATLVGTRRVNRRRRARQGRSNLRSEAPNHQ